MNTCAPPAQRITRDDKAWMAGVIETQGKIRFAMSGDHCQLVLQVQTGHLHIVRELCEMTGVKYDPKPPKEIKVSRRLCTDHCNEPHEHVLTTIPEMAMWAISGAGAAIILHNVYRHIRKRQGLEIVIDNILDGLPKESGRGRKAVDDTIIRLRLLGWKIPDAAMEGFRAKPAKRGPGGKFVKAKELVPA